MLDAMATIAIDERELVVTLAPEEVRRRLLERLAEA